jgi:hypothetical protein
VSYCGILFSHKNGIVSFARKLMELDIIMLSEISQTQTNTTFSLYAEARANEKNEHE